MRYASTSASPARSCCSPRSTTSISGFGRLAYSLGEHGQLPAVFGRLNRRTLVSPRRHRRRDDRDPAHRRHVVHAIESTFLASLFCFGVLLAFTAAQLAVIRLRMTEPELRRPFRVPLNIRVRGVAIPFPSLFGAVCTAAIFVIAIVTHPGARYGGPAWLVGGIVVYVMCDGAAALG